MQTIYYAWVIRHISESVRMLIPKEIIVLIANLTKLIRIEYMITDIDTSRITVAPIQDGTTQIHYNNENLLVKTSKFELKYDTSQYEHGRAYPTYIILHFNNQTGCVYFNQFMETIDTLVCSIVVKKLLFKENWYEYTYQPCVIPVYGIDDFFGPSHRQIKMRLCKEDYENYQSNK